MRSLLLRYNPPALKPAEIVSGLLSICFPDASTAVDLTPGHGGFWNGQTQVSVEKSKFDFRDLPYENESFDVVLFDPPHNADAGRQSIMRRTFGTYPYNQLRSVIEDGCREAWRVARIGVIVKVTDQVHAQTFQHQTGWVCGVLGTPYECVVGQHYQVEDGRWRMPALSARSNGSTYLAFRRGDQRHLRRGPKPPPVLL